MFTINSISNNSKLPFFLKIRTKLKYTTIEIPSSNQQDKMLIMITEKQKLHLILVQKKHHKKKKELTHQQYKNISKAKKLKLSQLHKNTN